MPCGVVFYACFVEINKTYLIVELDELVLNDKKNVPELQGKTMTKRFHSDHL